MKRPARRGQAGFTMVELMITMTLTTLMVGIVFTMLVQLSTAYRSQGKISDLQQTLVAAQSLIVRDIRQAGLMVPNGYKVAYDTDIHQPVEIVDDNAGPDTVTVAFADPSAQAFVSAFGVGNGSLTVDDADLFQPGDLAVIVDPRDPPANVTPAPPQTFDTCVVKIVDASGTAITLDTAAPWGNAGNTHCTAVRAAHNATASPDTMIYRFAIRGYRVDLTRPELAVLQRSLTGGVENDWEDMGLGFTDLQVATRWSEPGDVNDTTDPDTDPAKDWYSGDDQDTLTEPSVAEKTVFPIEITVSFVVRTNQSVAGVVSDQTPELTVTGNLDHNTIGDRPAEQLDGVADAARPPELVGNHVYRWATFRVDLRNLGVAR